MDHMKKMPELIRQRNEKIIEEFDRLVAEEKRVNPERAAFISRQYYIRMVFLNMDSGLSENYIAKIINARHSL